MPAKKKSASKRSPTPQAGDQDWLQFPSRDEQRRTNEHLEALVTGTSEPSSKHRCQRNSTSHGRRFPNQHGCYHHCSYRGSNYPIYNDIYTLRGSKYLGYSDDSAYYSSTTDSAARTSEAAFTLAKSNAGRIRQLGCYDHCSYRGSNYPIYNDIYTLRGSKYLGYSDDSAYYSSTTDSAARTSEAAFTLAKSNAGRIRQLGCYDHCSYRGSNYPIYNDIYTLRGSKYLGYSDDSAYYSSTTDSAARTSEAAFTLAKSNAGRIRQLGCYVQRLRLVLRPGPASHPI